LLPERLQARQVRVITQTAGRVLQLELADLPVDPRSVDLDRLAARPERRPSSAPQGSGRSTIPGTDGRLQPFNVST
jgi:hypothetical protein